jgi:hypothetical protein
MAREAHSIELASKEWEQVDAMGPDADRALSLLVSEALDVRRRHATDGPAIALAQRLDTTNLELARYLGRLEERVAYLEAKVVELQDRGQSR